MTEPTDPTEVSVPPNYQDAMLYGYGITKGGRHVPLQDVYVTKELPTYVCHKRVRASEVVSIGLYKTNADNKAVREIQISDQFDPIEILGEVFTRYVPMPGDFYVVYEDGYVSFSPRKAFIEGYTLAQPENVLMERLNDVASLAPPDSVSPEWMHGRDWPQQLARVAREAYVTINSLKLQLENLKREKADPDQA